MEKVKEVYEENKERLEKGIIDVVYVDLSPAEKMAGLSTRVSVDKYGQVYMNVSGYVGAGIGTFDVGFSKILGNGANNMSKEAMASNITGWGASVAAIGGVGGAISVGNGTGAVDLLVGPNIYINASIGRTEKIGSIYGDAPAVNVFDKEIMVKFDELIGEQRVKHGR